MEVIADPERLAAQNLSLEQLVSAVRSASLSKAHPSWSLGNGSSSSEPMDGWTIWRRWQPCPFE